MHQKWELLWDIAFRVILGGPWYASYDVLKVLVVFICPLAPIEQINMFRCPEKCLPFSKLNPQTDCKAKNHTKNGRLPPNISYIEEVIHIWAIKFGIRTFEMLSFNLKPVVG